MEPRLLQLINNVILFAIDGKPIQHVAVLLNDDSENVPVGFTGHISFEARVLMEMLLWSTSQEIYQGTPMRIHRKC